MNQYSVMASKLTRPKLLSVLSKEDREAAVHTANVLQLVSDFIEGIVPSQIQLADLIKAEETYERLTGETE